MCDQELSGCLRFPCGLFGVQMALTAGSPVFRGKLVDTDTRWDVISSSVDCRTPAERGLTSEVRGQVAVVYRKCA